MKYKKGTPHTNGCNNFFYVRVESQFKYKLHINKTGFFNIFSIILLNFSKSYEQKQTKIFHKKLNILSFMISLANPQIFFTLSLL